MHFLNTAKKRQKSEHASSEIFDQIDNLGDVLTRQTMQKPDCRKPVSRETARTTGQLRLFASLVEEALDSNRIDTAIH